MIRPHLLGKRYIFLLAAIPTVGLTGWNFKRAIPGLSNPDRSRIMKKLAKKFDLKRVLPQIEAELTDAEVIKFQDHKIYLTENWLVYQTLYDFIPIEYKSIVWFYKSVTDYKVSGATAACSHQIAIHDRFGDRYLVGVPNREVNRIFQNN